MTDILIHTIANAMRHGIAEHRLQNARAAIAADPLRALLGEEAVNAILEGKAGVYRLYDGKPFKFSTPKTAGILQVLTWKRLDKPLMEDDE